MLDIYSRYCPGHIVLPAEEGEAVLRRNKADLNASAFSKLSSAVRALKGGVPLSVAIWILVPLVV